MSISVVSHNVGKHNNMAELNCKQVLKKGYEFCFQFLGEKMMRFFSWKYLAVFVSRIATNLIKFVIFYFTFFFINKSLFLSFLKLHANIIWELRQICLFQNLPCIPVFSFEWYLGIGVATNL